LTWWNSQVATLGIEAVTRKTWVEMKVMTTEEFCPPKEIQRMECELWNLRVKEMDVSSYTTCFNELMILCPGMVPTDRKKVEAYIRGLSKNIKGEVMSSEPITLNKAVRMRERVQNEANRIGGPNVASVAWKCTFADFMKCIPITFRGNEGAVGQIRWIEKTEMVFTVATLGIEAVTRKTWVEMKV
nr:hypothetical protein [Tanacetum cinerariifolium]